LRRAIVRLARRSSLSACHRLEGLRARPSRIDTGAPIPGTAFTAKHFGTSALTFAPHGQIYTFRWQTVARWAGSCREFDLTLAGGITRSVIFSFAPPG
jgi:hypothetical protein